MQEKKPFLESIFDIMILRVNVLGPGRRLLVHRKRMRSRDVDVHDSWDIHDRFFLPRFAVD